MDTSSASSSGSGGRPGLQAQLLGRCTVLVGGQLLPEAAFKRRRAFRLLLLLLATPGHSVSKDVVLETLWPERDPQLSGVSLRVVLSVLRGVLAVNSCGEPIVIGAGVTIRLNPDLDIHVDVTAFERLAREGLASNKLDVLRQAIDAYGGALLPTMAYEEWVERLRSALAKLHERVLLRIADVAESHSSVFAAECLHLVEGHLFNELTVDPTNEAVAFTLMRLLAHAGRNVEALRTYEDLAAALRNDLGVPPGHDLEVLRRRLTTVTVPASARRLGYVAASEAGLRAVLLYEERLDRDTSGTKLGVPAAAGAGRVVQMLQCIESAGGTAHTLEDEYQVLGTFPRISAALRAARVMLRLARQRSRGQNSKTSPAIAIHCGEISEIAVSLQEPVVRHLVCLLRLARGGQIVVSEAAALVVRDSLPAKLQLLRVGPQAVSERWPPEHVFVLRGRVAAGGGPP